MEQPIGAALLARISWDDLRVFVVVVRTLSFRKAAAALRTSSSTIARRMERLEETFGFRLFDRLPDGVGLTLRTPDDCDQLFRLIATRRSD